MAEHITAGEFDRMTRRMFEQLDRIEVQTNATNGRVLKLEANQAAAGKMSAKLSTAVAILVTGTINGVLAFIGGK